MGIPLLVGFDVLAKGVARNVDGVLRALVGLRAHFHKILGILHCVVGELGSAAFSSHIFQAVAFGRSERATLDVEVVVAVDLHSAGLCGRGGLWLKGAVLEVHGADTCCPPGHHACLLAGAAVDDKFAAGEVEVAAPRAYAGRYTACACAPVLRGE